LSSDGLLRDFSMSQRHPCRQGKKNAFNQRSLDDDANCTTLHSGSMRNWRFTALAKEFDKFDIAASERLVFLKISRATRARPA